MANIRILDEQEYQRYVDRTDEIFSRYNGTYLAVDKKPGVLEGKWNYSRAVLIRFASKADFEAWYFSPEYQEILRLRLSAAECDSILIEGE
jgi:uncharacterized protein (DUF1330 family)